MLRCARKRAHRSFNSYTFSKALEFIMLAPNRYLAEQKRNIHLFLLKCFFHMCFVNDLIAENIGCSAVNIDREFFKAFLTL